MGDCLCTHVLNCDERIYEIDYRIEIKQKSNSMSAPLRFISSRVSPRASHRRHSRKFPARFVFVFKYKTSAFVTGKCGVKVKSAGELTRMAY